MTKCPTCGRARTRSSEQNRRYWLLLNVISEKLKPQGAQFSSDNWHTYFRQRFLGSTDLLLPNGKTVTIPQTTTSLDVGDFNDYMTKVEVWANEHGIYLDE